MPTRKTLRNSGRRPVAGRARRDQKLQDLPGRQPMPATWQGRRASTAHPSVRETRTTSHDRPIGTATALRDRQASTTSSSAAPAATTQATAAIRPPPSGSAVQHPSRPVPPQPRHPSAVRVWACPPRRSPTVVPQRAHAWPSSRRFIASETSATSHAMKSTSSTTRAARLCASRSAAQHGAARRSTAQHGVQPRHLPLIGVAQRSL